MQYTVFNVKPAVYLGAPSAVQYSEVQYSAVQYSEVQYSAVCRCPERSVLSQFVPQSLGVSRATLYSMFRFPDSNTVLHSTAWLCTVLHCTALPCTALRCTALHCTALRCTD